MKRYIPVQEAFKRYESIGAIENHYPGIFDEGNFHKHVQEHDGEWMVEDKSCDADRDNSNARLTREEMMAIAQAVGVK